MDILLGIVISAFALTGWVLSFKYKQTVEDYEIVLSQKKFETALLYKTLKELRSSKENERVIYKDKILYESGFIIPEGTIDAVKLAMKVSHPDNGGKNEDFIKYNKIYQELACKKSTKRRG